MCIISKYKEYILDEVNDICKKVCEDNPPISVQSSSYSTGPRMSTNPTYSLNNPMAHTFNPAPVPIPQEYHNPYYSNPPDYSYPQQYPHQNYQNPPPFYNSIPQGIVMQTSDGGRPGIRSMTPEYNYPPHGQDITPIEPPGNPVVQPPYENSNPPSLNQSLNNTNQPEIRLQGPNDRIITPNQSVPPIMLQSIVSEDSALSLPTTENMMKFKCPFCDVITEIQYKDDNVVCSACHASIVWDDKYIVTEEQVPNAYQYFGTCPNCSREYIFENMIEEFVCGCGYTTRNMDDINMFKMSQHNDI